MPADIDRPDSSGCWDVGLARLSTRVLTNLLGIMLNEYMCLTPETSFMKCESFLEHDPRKQLSSARRSCRFPAA